MKIWEFYIEYWQKSRTIYDKLHNLSSDLSFTIEDLKNTYPTRIVEEIGPDLYWVSDEKLLYRVVEK